MRKPVKKRGAKPRRPSSDPNLHAHQLMTEHMERLETSIKPWDTRPANATVDPEPDVTAIISAHMAKLGAKGGKIGGKRRLETMSQEARTANARKAVQARWAKRPR